MFPNEAHFICRRCSCHFYFTPDLFYSIETSKKIGCPKCGTTCKESGKIQKFFKYYPRFLIAEQNLIKSGFELVTYRFTVHEFGYFYIDHVTFRCSVCGVNSEYPMSRIAKFADEPGLFACKKCKVQASPLKVVKEFFVKFRAVDRESAFIHDFLWDIFSPLHLDPNDYPVQFRGRKSEMAE